METDAFRSQEDGNSLLNGSVTVGAQKKKIENQVFISSCLIMQCWTREPGHRVHSAQLHSQIPTAVTSRMLWSGIKA